MAARQGAAGDRGRVLPPYVEHVVVAAGEAFGAPQGEVAPRIGPAHEKRSRISLK